MDSLEDISGLKPINLTVVYQGKLQELTGTESDPIVVSENAPFVFILKSIFDKHPEIEATYPPGDLGIAVNDHPPVEFETLQDGDVITLFAAGKHHTKWVN